MFSKGEYDVTLLVVGQVAVVTVAFPATPLLLARARICISASHTKDDLLEALEVSLYFGYCNFLLYHFYHG